MSDLTENSLSYVERPRFFCSLGGALSTLEALPDTVAILHAAIGCSGSIAWAQNGGSALNVGGYCGGLSVPSTNVIERDIVFGGLDRLSEEVKSTVELMDAKLYVIITGCVTEIIGDDIRSVAAEYNDSPYRVVSANTGGFKGNSYLGYDIVMSQIVRQFVKSDVPKVKKRVNVLGVVPFMDCFWRGNLKNVRRLLEGVGLEVNTFFTSEDSLEAIEASGSAELNIVLSDVYGLETAQAYAEVHDIDYISSPLPIGPSASAQLIRQIASIIDLDVDVEAYIEAQSRLYYESLEPLIDLYNDADLQKYAVIVGDVNYAVSLTKFLSDDVGWIPVLTLFTDTLTEVQKLDIAEKLTHNVGVVPRIVFDTNATEASRYIAEIYPKTDDDLYGETLSPAFVIGSSLERSLATKLAAPHLSVSFPVANRAVVSRGYTGFDGGLTLIEDLLSAAVNAR
jgi:nitrogenase molybdenum-iron protein beta chain